MKTSSSALNPYAESYVPVSLREESSWNEGTAVSDDHATEKLNVTDDSKYDHHQGTASHSNQVTEMKFTDEEHEMDLAYLLAYFPDMSEQSLIDVYTVNKGDLDASVDMLRLLESEETSDDSLPDALDIGDVPETTPSGECSKTMAGESSRSASGSDLVVPSDPNLSQTWALKKCSGSSPHQV